jgi:hypothetical protein
MTGSREIMLLNILFFINPYKLGKALYYLLTIYPIVTILKM